MTNDQIQQMRDGVKTLRVGDAAKLPIYDNVRGTVAGGMPAEQYFALIDGARPGPATSDIGEYVRDNGGKLASRMSYEDRISNAWKQA